MPPIGLPKEDLNIEPKHQLLTAGLLGGLLVVFSVVSTVLVMRGLEQRNAPEETGVDVVAGSAAQIVDPNAPIDPKAFVASFESTLRDIKTVENNLFTIERLQTALDVRAEERTELRTYVSWSRMEGMPSNEAWVKIDLIKITKGEDPVRTHAEVLLREAQLILVDGVTVMFDPVSDAEALFTLNTTQFWADQHPGGKWK